jgi:predicted secreted protein
MKLILILSVLLISTSIFASQREFINTLGASPKGQFVALEEYGYKPHKKEFYSHIRIINVWKNEYVGKVINVEMPAMNSKLLEETRSKARQLASDELKKFQISG